MRKVLFLDIDGVLNPKWWDRKKHIDIYGGAFDPKAVANLAQIIEKTGAEIVISSSWKELGLSELRNMWKERKLPGKIIDVTPDYMSDELLFNADLNDTDIDHLYIRGCEIKGWLELHGADVSHYVIIDDMNDVIPEQQSHLVQTDPEIGISDCDVKMAILILKHLGGMDILIIGVGSPGVIAVDKMNVLGSKKLFIDSSYYTLKDVKSEGEKIGIYCKARAKCPSLYCNCYNNPDFCKEIVAEYEDEIRESIINALK